VRRPRRGLAASLALALAFALAAAAAACAGARPPFGRRGDATLPRSLRVVGPAGAPEQLTLGVPLRLSEALLERTTDSTLGLRPGALPGATGVRVYTAAGRVRAIHFDVAGGAAGDSALSALGLAGMRDAAAAGFLDMEGSVVTWWEDERTKLLRSSAERYAAGGGRPGAHYVLLDRRLSGH